ncbi:hypothetical protein Lpp48_00315 [Lacticaseibacillus paracasei subsp. paracasei Lpp48]|nr:hypothetical protein Lpp48_00315 [Lacticaseibacillus paracasei subsp. paracasei Lpp48]
MGMLEKKPAQKTGKSLLRHTPGGVEVENQVDRESIIQSVKETAAPKKKPAEKTTSIRISVTTRNALNSLVTLGEADTVNTLLDQLITENWSHCAQISSALTTSSTASPPSAIRLRALPT